MRKPVRASLALALTLLVAGFSFPAGAQGPALERLPKAGVSDSAAVAKAAANAAAPEMLVDANGDRIFDNLAVRLATAAPADRFDVIVQFSEPAGPLGYAAVERLAGPVGYKAKWDVAIQGFASRLTRAQIEALSRAPFVKQVEADLEVRALLNTATRDTGVNKARLDFSVDGDRNGSPTSYSTTDVVVAVLDTGIDAAHVDLDGGKVIGWRDEINGQASPYDDQGHGTHVASIIAGTGEGSSSYKGVAPGTALVGIKVLNSAGSGTTTQIINGINWMISNKATYNIRVGNMSLGASGCSNGTDSLSTAVNNAVSNGITMAVAAGNDGPAKCTIGTPGAAANAITVGAAYDIGELGWAIAEFSSRGPTADGRTKPDIVTPGRYITAAKANSTNQYITYSGTSMATPFMAGVIALMLDANNTLTDTGIKDILYNSANYEDRGPAGKDVDYGYGLNLAYNSIKAAGGFTGTFDDGQGKGYGSATLTGTGDFDDWTISVTSTSVPVAVTLIMTNWTGASSPDFDLYVYNPSGTLVGSSEGTTRQELVRLTPTVTGTYKIRVKSYTGSGAYFIDVSWK